MKYRIVTDGSKFRIQYRFLGVLWLWQEREYYICDDHCWETVEFNTLIEAKNYIIKRTQINEIKEEIKWSVVYEN